MNLKKFSLVLGCSALFSVAAADSPKGMALIPAGAFTMGSPKDAGNDDEHPAHPVELDAFYLDERPVTNQDFQNFVTATGYVTDAEKNGGGYIYDCSGAPAFVMTAKAIWKDPNGDKKGILAKMNNPVVQVDWYDANAYAKWAGKRLPTEAEYEKSVRGKTTTTYFFGDKADFLGLYAWLYGSGDTHSVGSLKPNPFGVYDILGNVWEWCSDWYGEQYYAASPGKNPKGPESGKYRVIRGGSWVSGADYERSAARSWNFPEYRSYNIGFRCAATP